MKFTDLFIKRPVLSCVLSLLVLVLGARSIMDLELRQYPKTENTLITITTSYPGADSELIKGFITTPLQQAVAEANGIDYIKSTSRPGLSIIEIFMRLNFDSGDAVAEIQAKVASQRSVLPRESNDPVIDVQTGNRLSLMYLSFYSEKMSPTQMTDYVLRVVQPRIQALPGVAKARMFGQKKYAMRIWLDPLKMAAMGVTASDVRMSLLANNYLSGSGETKGVFVAIDLSATTDISDPDEFKNLVVREEEGVIVRLSDVADVRLGAEDYESTAWYNGKTALFIGVTPTPGANPLLVADAVKQELPLIRNQMPADLKVFVPYDASEFIRESINEVFLTLFEAIVIVLGVILITLGSIRAAIIPALAVPLCLVGAAFLMMLLGFSINLLTLLAMVLAIGLVVDDAIVVTENVHRHIELGKEPTEAAIIGARQLVSPIIAMTTTLVAVYAPIGFMGGLVGTLFTEFAFALAGAVIISGFVALTLSPMLCSKLLIRGAPTKLEHMVTSVFDRLTKTYSRALAGCLNLTSVLIFFGCSVLLAIYFLYSLTRSELAPVEDQSILYISGTAPQTATIDYNKKFASEMISVFEKMPDYKESFLVLGFNSARYKVFGGFKMPTTDLRETPQWEVQGPLQKGLSEVTGLQAATFARPSLPSPGRGLPIQFVLTGPVSAIDLEQFANQVIQEGMLSGNFAFLRKSIEYNRPKTTINIDRDKAGMLGINMDDLGIDLATLLGGNYVNWFKLQGRSYKVIPQVSRNFRNDESMLEQYYVRTSSGKMIPLSSVASFSDGVEPSERLQFQQLNAIVIEGVAAPSVAMGTAMKSLEAVTKRLLPNQISWDYAGESRQYVQQSSVLVATFFVALLVIYLVLAAQFESWRDPFIILVSVPMSVAGALLFMAMGFASSNIYTQVGLITLIGLVAKNGILIVEFANRLMEEKGLERREAVERAASVRLRPILMTTVATIVAMIPLLMATGPGAVSRSHIGLVIASGLGIGTFFTLFMVPGFYVALSASYWQDLITFFQKNKSMSQP